MDRKEYIKQWRADNKERIRQYNQQWYKDNLDHVREYRRQPEVAEVHRAEVRRWHAENKDRVNERRNERYQTDETFRLKLLLRNRLNQALKNKVKTGSAVDLLGCSIEEFKTYLEGLFTEGMSWTNKGEWEIDHIRPLASFDLTDSEQLADACHYSNLQPLWRLDNLRKGGQHRLCERA